MNAGGRDPAADWAGQQPDHAGVPDRLRLGEHQSEPPDPVGDLPVPVRLSPTGVVAVPPAGRRTHGQPGPAGIAESKAGHTSRVARDGVQRAWPRQPGSTLGAGVVVKLGTWLDNARKRAAKLPEQRRTDLDALGMRW